MQAAGTEEERALQTLSRFPPGGNDLSDFAIRMHLKYAIKYMSNLEQLAETEAEERLMRAEEIENLDKASSTRRRLARVFLLASFFLFLLPPAGVAAYLLTGIEMKGWSVLMVIPALALAFLSLCFVFRQQARIILLRKDITIAEVGGTHGRELSQLKRDLRPWIEQGYILEGPVRLGKI